jgi:hypothetical protein
MNLLIMKQRAGKNRGICGPVVRDIYPLDEVSVG